MSPNASSPALEAAAIFLARPLVLLGTHSPTTLVALQGFLQSALSPRSHLMERLSFTTTSLPPLPIQLACVAFGIKWAHWIRALGGAAFDLFIEPTRVYVVKKSTGQVGVIWVAKDASDVSRSILVSKAPVSPETDSEPESDLSDGEFDDAPPSSRPSSRSSTVSDSTFSSSSRSSHTSASSISSLPSIAKPALAPAPKPQTTKYLYQGGVSTVLTGGVMLGGGGGGCAAPRPCVAPVPVRTTVPVYTPPHRTRTRAQATSAWASKDRATGTGSWRRNATAA
ncbi:hypothetical protein D9615_010538 [Tricholomella constricta]|uniref:Anti-proliferative protein domain-containing protein n=1 Tax=Tricholomella constricta TaxID=117010 RepID=A0A8H5GKQ0_9AGAR|nr:hypothetical protein D9615_010538 [Tricholomella constricta]